MMFSVLHVIMWTGLFTVQVIGIYVFISSCLISDFF